MKTLLNSDVTLIKNWIKNSVLIVKYKSTNSVLMNRGTN